MGLAEAEEELALRASRFVRTCRSHLWDLAEHLKEYGLPNEAEASIKAKLRRGTFTATFLLATLAALAMGSR